MNTDTIGFEISLIEDIAGRTAYLMTWSGRLPHDDETELMMDDIMFRHDEIRKERKEEFTLLLWNASDEETGLPSWVEYLVIYGKPGPWSLISDSGHSHTNRRKLEFRRTGCRRNTRAWRMGESDLTDFLIRYHEMFGLDGTESDDNAPVVLSPIMRDPII